jgi:hypothetical protein
LFDSDLPELYEVETKLFDRAIKIFDQEGFFYGMPLGP